MSAIVDASCFILLAKINRLDLLHATYQRVISTDEVAGEYGTLPGWVEIEPISDRGLYTLLKMQFGAGESSCIALAATSPGTMLILDDRRARRRAESLELTCCGSLGVLLEAKRLKVIDAVAPLLQEITQTNFRVSDEVIDQALRDAGEV